MVLQGRGLFYGAPHGTMDEQTWNGACKQAKEWGMTYVHPKVADRTGYWYTPDEMVMLRGIAREYGLLCYPYYYVTVTNWQRQADMAATVGNISGGLILDMEDEWFRQPAVAAAFGERLRAQFHGLVIPTLYADPQIISQFPYTETLKWCDAWMPMAYFDVWRERGMPMTAVEASAWLQPQWNELNKHLVSQGISARPLLPLIATANLPEKEVVGWLRAWYGILGYCGFWYDGTYAPYAAAVLGEPAPTWRAPGPASDPQPAPKPKPVPKPVPEPVRTSTPPPAPVIQEQVPFLPQTDLPANVFIPVQTSGLAQHLSESELLALWRRNDASVPWDPSHALVRTWLQIVQFHPELGIGAPVVRDEQHADTNGQPMQFLRLDSGHWLTYYLQSGRVALTGGGTLVAGALLSAPAALVAAPVDPVTPVPPVPVGGGAAQ